MTLLTVGAIEGSDNIFALMNISTVEQAAAVFQTIGQEARLEILPAIGDGETCVCQLETMLGLRQAGLSQHLMALCEAWIVSDWREGTYIHYRLREPALLDLVHHAAQFQSLELPCLTPFPDCDCPNCSERRNNEN